MSALALSLDVPPSVHHLIHPMLYRSPAPESVPVLVDRSGTAVRCVVALRQAGLFFPLCLRGRTRGIARSRLSYPSSLRSFMSLVLSSCSLPRALIWRRRFVFFFLFSLFFFLSHVFVFFPMRQVIVSAWIKYLLATGRLHCMFRGSWLAMCRSGLIP